MKFEKTHGMSRTRIYRTWQGMHERCYNSKRANHKNYGGRGVAVCERWHTFENFYADMGDKPSPKHSLDRINNDGDYCLDNCKWSTPQEQIRNQRALGKSGIKGVCWREKWGKWEVSLKIGSNRMYLGAYASLLDAASVRKSAENKYWVMESGANGNEK